MTPTDITYDDIAHGNGVTLGRARYLADHGNEHAHRLLQRVDHAYTAAYLDTHRNNEHE